MGQNPFQSITVVGVGLLGGSLGLAVKAVDPAVRVTGVVRRPESVDEALAAGVVDAATLDLSAAVAGADLVVLCAPVGQFRALLAAVRPALKPGALVTDVGSTKAEVVRLAERALPDGVFVGSHPMAGGERSGVAYSRDDLYTNHTCILTPTPRTAPAALARVEALWRSLRMHTVQLSPAAHDRALARVSHLPHALAALLVNLQKPAELDLAGPGFVDATRIAGGDPAMWRDIFLSNRKAMLKALDALSAEVADLRARIDASDGAGLVERLSAAQRRRAEMLARRLARGDYEG